MLVKIGENRWKSKCSLCRVLSLSHFLHLIAPHFSIKMHFRIIYWTYSSFLIIQPDFPVMLDNVHAQGIGAINNIQMWRTAVNTRNTHNKNANKTENLHSSFTQQAQPAWIFSPYIHRLLFCCVLSPLLWWFVRISFICSAECCCSKAVSTLSHTDTNTHTGTKTRR